MSFQIHHLLQESCIELSEISRCHVLLKNETTFPWLILVPVVDEHIEDLHHLPDTRYLEIMQLIRTVSGFVDGFFRPEKLNVGCIGNQVRQMHIHVIARNPSDKAWPGVVWGADYIETEYTEDQISHIKNAFEQFLQTEDPELKAQ